MTYSANIKKFERHFLPHDFKVNNWETLEPYFKELVERNIETKQDLEQLLKDQSEINAVIDEEATWRYIRMTCDTQDKQLEESFNYFHLHIQPKIQTYTDTINKKIVQSTFVGQLDQQKYFTYLRNVQEGIELFRQQNVPLQAEASVLQRQYGQITGAMMVTIKGEQYTLQQASKFMDNPDRSLREEVYIKIQERRLQDKDKLDDLFNKLIGIRDQQARNAGLSNYREYRFKELHRFDYTKKECIEFHDAVKLYVIPLVQELYTKKKEKLGVDLLQPWDLSAEPYGIEPLKPFETGDELLEKSILCMKKLLPFFGECLEKMKTMGHLDLESRKGKAPGGYNSPLLESGAPFIFMNAAGQMHDVTTMVHEGGHAVQSFLTNDLELTGFKDYPMEIAEVASMSMELFTMDYWDTFFSDPQDLKRAKEHQLERVITLFPWIAIIDKFQHWIYENPAQSTQERTIEWTNILEEFKDGIIDYSGLEQFREIAWQRQLHLFEVPFYYIEYGIAQLGAVGMWMQYKINPESALQNYCNALQLGATRTLPELYKVAGLEFDFSPSRIKTLMDFVSGEIKKL